MESIVKVLSTMKNIKMKTLHLLFLGTLLFHTTHAFANCWRQQGTNLAICELSASLYPTTKAYKGVNYGILVSASDRDPDLDPNKNGWLINTNYPYGSGISIHAMKLNDKNTTYKYYTNRMSQWKAADHPGHGGEWHTYGHPFCFSFNKASFRVDSKEDYNGSYDINGYNGMGFFKAYLKFDPKPQTFLYYDSFTKKYVRGKVDAILSGGAIPSFATCNKPDGERDRSGIGNAKDPYGNKSRWQIWYPPRTPSNENPSDHEEVGVLYDSQYFFLYDTANYTCSGSPIQPRNCRQWNDTADNCAFYDPH